MNSVAVEALRRMPLFDFGFRRLVDVLRFVAIAVVGCTMLSASVGVTTLCIAGVQGWRDFAALRFDWWLAAVVRLPAPN